MKRVYFIKPIGMDGPIKIGCSQSPDQRCETLAVWSPFPLEIVAEIEGDIDLERRFHAKFATLHVHKEWFEWSDELAADIAAIRAGTFNLDGLPSPQQLPRKAPAKPRGSGLWTEEEKARNRRRKAMLATEKSSGLVCDFPHTPESVDAFIADPVANGVTIAHRRAGSIGRMAEYRLLQFQSDVVSISASGQRP